MAATIHLNGPARIYWLGQNLGYSTDGVNIMFNAKFFDIPTDRSGWMMPENVLLMGEEAMVSFELIVYDKGVLDWIVNRDASSTNSIPNSNVGKLMMKSKNDFNTNDTTKKTGRLSIWRTNSCINEQDSGYDFFESYLADSYTKKLSTRTTKIGMTFRCLPLMVDNYDFQYLIPAGTIFARS